TRTVGTDFHVPCNCAGALSIEPARRIIQQPFRVFFSLDRAIHHITYAYAPTARAAFHRPGTAETSPPIPSSPAPSQFANTPSLDTYASIPPRAAYPAATRPRAARLLLSPGGPFYAPLTAPGRELGAAVRL